MNESWNIRELMKFWEFRENLSKKMLTQNPTSLLYRSDENMRESSTQIPMQRKRGRPKKDNNDKHTTTFNTFKRAWHTRHCIDILCGDMEMFQKHVLSKVNVKKPKLCEVCGIDIYTACGL